MKQVRYNILMLTIVIIFSSIVSLYSWSNHQNEVDAVIFSFDRPLQLWSLLESMEQKMTGTASNVVIIRTSSHRYRSAYDIVQKRFSWARFDYQEGHDFKVKTLHALKTSSAPNFFFAVDDIIVAGSVDVTACGRWLDTFNAFGFYLRLGKHITHCYSLNIETGIPPLQGVREGVLRWRFDEGKGDWGFPASVDMTVWRKSDIMPLLDRYYFDNPTKLESILESLPKNRFGLCFESAKMVNLPLNLVNKTAPGNRYMAAITAYELLEKFEQGYTFDTRPLALIVPQAPHMEYMPPFIKRPL